MNNFEKFKQKLKERTDKIGYIKEGHLLLVDGYLVNNAKLCTDCNDDEYVLVSFLAGTMFDCEIYQHDVDEDMSYVIEWFALENEDE